MYLKTRGRLNQLKGEIKRRWGKLTFNDVLEAQGDLEKLIGKIQQRSGKHQYAIRKWFRHQNI
ncbi:MAG: CsbD family protein [Candidatus Binataceae bacterium]